MNNQFPIIGEYNYFAKTGHCTGYFVMDSLLFPQDLGCTLAKASWDNYQYWGSNLYRDLFKST